MTLAATHVNLRDALAVWRRTVEVHLRLWKMNLIAPAIEPYHSPAEGSVRNAVTTASTEAATRVTRASTLPVIAECLSASTTIERNL